MTIQAIFFDVGETLVNEHRYWEGWAEYLRVPVADFYAVLVDIIGRGEHHHAAFRHFREGFDLIIAREDRQRDGQDWIIGKGDLYPDALPCLKSLREKGIRIGIAGNQPRTTEDILAGLGLNVDYLASSETWGIEKPNPAFFELILELTGLPAKQVGYVGDRLDNDVIPARSVGMKTIFIKRGPWGKIHANDPRITQSDITINGLTELIPAIEKL